MKLVFATHNRGKVEELRALLVGLPIEVVTLAELGIADDVVEDADTFEGNARIKAEAALARTGFPSLADDSGLEVDALGGAPGVHSARYGGEPRSDERNWRKLLEALKDVPPPRTARFRCVLALARAGESVVFAEGACEGEVLDAPRGEHGFGYDPVLRIAGRSETMAELPLAEKNALSHRAQAMRQMARVLADVLRTSPDGKA